MKQCQFSLTIWNPKFILIFRNVVPTSQKTHYVSVTRNSRFILFREINAVYSENHAKHINTPFGMKEFWISKYLVYIVTLRFNWLKFQHNPLCILFPCENRETSLVLARSLRTTAWESLLLIHWCSAHFIACLLVSSKAYLVVTSENMT
jgi:hypothetical protein